MGESERMEELVRMAIEGDARSFAQLYESVYKELYKMAHWGIHMMLRMS